MSRIGTAVLSAALFGALAAVPASAHEGDPHYRSVVREIVPHVPGLSAQVLDHDDALLLVNHANRDVVVLARDETPYARLLRDGTVQVNEHAPPLDAEEAHGDAETHADRGARLSASLDGRFLAHGDDEHGAGEPSAPAQPGARPLWRTIDRTGRLEWHDARIKYRASAVPPQVTDQSRETKVKDWRVPLHVAGEPAAILGTLTWVGDPGAGSGVPAGAVVSLAVLALLAVGAVVLVRRRRRSGEAGTP